MVTPTSVSFFSVHPVGRRRWGCFETYIDNARDMALDGDTTQHQIDLVVGVAEALEVLHDAEAALAVRHGGVHVMLLAVLVDAEALKVNHATR